MVDDKDNPVGGQGETWQLPLLLLGGFRAFIDQAHGRLAARGFADVRPVHGFALQAVAGSATAGEVARRLGVSKQAAAKTIAGLEERGWVRRDADPADARRQLVVTTDRGRALLAASVEVFAEVAARWGAAVGVREVEQMQRTLTRLGVAEGARLDVGTWSSRVG